MYEVVEVIFTKEENWDKERKKMLLLISEFLNSLFSPSVYRCLIQRGQPSLESLAPPQLL